MGTSVVSGGDAAPVLEFSEHILDLVSLAIQGLIIDDLLASVALWWDTGADPALDETLPEPIGVIALFGQQVP